MKKLLIGALAAVLLVAVIATSAFAANSEHKRNFADENGNGICDNREAKKENCSRNFADENGDGVCDNRETKKEICSRNFADANNDGICDNRADRVRPQDGTGKGNCMRRGCGR